MSDLDRSCCRNLALEQQAQEQGRMIKDAANRELGRIQREIDSIAPGATLVDPELASRYSELVSQRAQLLSGT